MILFQKDSKREEKLKTNNKLARSTESGLGAAMFVTHAPCMDCAKLIYQSGIASVYYRQGYRDSSGVEFLGRCGIDIVQA